MNNLVLMPILIPLTVGMILVLFRHHLVLQRMGSMLAVLGAGICSIILLAQVNHEGIQTLQLGGWDAPFGVGMTADMFSVLLLITTSAVSLCCLLYAFRSIGREREKYFFYPLFLFLITGVNGSFLTGDLFNLYVCFEVMLISSYVLIVHGGTKIQLREAFKYILVNVVSSFLFLVAIAYLYSITGTLNLAHLSLRVAEAGQDGLITTVALLFIIVFGMKAGLFLFFWLPGSYSSPPTAIAAIFAALLTKVGIYAIIRMFTLIFYHETQITHLMIGILAGLTMLLGAIGAVAFNDIKKILTYNVIIGAGLVLASLAAFTEDAFTGMIYYFIHDMIIKSLLFLLGGTIIFLTGTSKIKEISGLIRTHPYLGWIFFIAALSVSGIPPFSGLLGKVLITKGTFYSGYYWLGAIGLMTSLMVLYSVMKIFMNVFWGETTLSDEMEKGTTRGLMLPMVPLTAATVLLGVGAEEVAEYVQTAAVQLLNPDLYIDAIFKGQRVP
ncbi:Na+/H+ antiporter subunit D [Bacillus benzoevorans]|uniref:Multicomponent Na+:H+ antiporter subunit D n=1 Tax=Bacillus benzoevorans TaxID=1456 RepID=A0A7X0LVJ3_9BACI|nr:Na+/H+ antiporter subunit D [Bacillus benzoevorans]MBB6444642.1 multicomponent Na+:H+ antiporter subunit D [Bacillus benzoevorans]